MRAGVVYIEPFTAVESGAPDSVTVKAVLHEVTIGGHLTPDLVTEVARGARVRISSESLAEVSSNRRAFEELIAAGTEVYGVTTGVGALITHSVDLDAVKDAQLNLLRSHASGTGPDLPVLVVRAALVVRLNSLALAHSAVRPVVLERIAQLLNAGFTPRVPQSGSLGASGDLAPSAHAFLPLVGEGEVTTTVGKVISGKRALSALRKPPLELHAKEGLALINGTQFMTGIGALLVNEVGEILDAADIAAAVSVDALRGHLDAFDPRVQNLRRLKGQSRSAANVRRIVHGSRRTIADHVSVQDPYSLRCVPQVHGAAREVWEFFRHIVITELGAVTDNPIMFTSEREVISAGNFHGQSLSVAFDALRLALADLASISERRTFRLLSPSTNGGIGAFLSPDPGPNSGYMAAQYTAAALVAELRALAHSVSIDNLTTSDGQEDHVSMGMTAAIMTLQALDLITNVLAIELLCGCQALDLDPEPTAGRGTRLAHKLVRDFVPPLGRDRSPAKDIASVRAALKEGLALEVFGRHPTR